ncbi:MAG: enoyl-CoA hydratase/isomerase family protein [Burkholderiales bacterium]|nr:enoyl-CoA hydratase/isomerase family protein [Burkholderiales bacterium]
MDNELIYELRDGIAHVTLNRPQARNALTYAMYEGLARIAGTVADDPAVRVVVIRGAGGKAFAAGTDISQFLEFESGEDGIAYEERLGRAVGILERCPKPVIAAIDGACTGGGAAIASVCDLRVATRASRIGFPIARTLGNCLSIHNVARLATLIGPTRVTELIFTGRLVDAAEAHAAGLVTEVVEDAEALTRRVDELARQVAGMAPLTLRATKEQLRRLREAMSAHVEDDDLVRLCFGSEDFRNGVRAFLERRPPAWQGR